MGSVRHSASTRHFKRTNHTGSWGQELVECDSAEMSGSYYRLGQLAAGLGQEKPRTQEGGGKLAALVRAAQELDTVDRMGKLSIK
jgi:hypothetical protein